MAKKHDDGLQADLFVPHSFTIGSSGYNPYAWQNKEEQKEQEKPPSEPPSVPSSPILHATPSREAYFPQAVPCFDEPRLYNLGNYGTPIIDGFHIANNIVLDLLSRSSADCQGVLDWIRGGDSRIPTYNEGAAIMMLLPKLNRLREHMGFSPFPSHKLLWVADAVVTDNDLSNLYLVDYNTGQCFSPLLNPEVKGAIWLVKPVRT